MKKLFILLPTLLFSFHSASFVSVQNQLLVGTAKVDITPYDYETHPFNKQDTQYTWGNPFNDTGRDQLFDFEEQGAFGDDQKPGIAGVDDDGDGIIDNCDRNSCKEYLAKGSDDLADPHRDNYHITKNPKGTEGDKKFQFLHLGGFSPFAPWPLPLKNRLAVGVHDPIWSRALALVGTNGKPIILIATDLPGLTWKYINPVRRRLEAATGVPFHNIVITSTHNHSGPDASGFFVTHLPGHNKAYTDKLKEWIFESGVAAFNDLQPARMKTVTTTHFSCYDAKTFELKKDPECRTPPLKSYYKKPDADLHYDRPLIQTDKRDPVVRNTEIVASQFISEADGSTIATFINWHNHPDSIRDSNVWISSDYPHYLRKFVEHHLGGNAIYFTGTLGCQIGDLPSVQSPLWNENFERVYRDDGLTDPHGNPVPEFVRTGWNKIRSTGYEVGNEIVNALQNEPTSTGDVPIEMKTEALDIRIDNLLHVLATKSVWRFDVEKEDRMRYHLAGCMFRYGCVRTDISSIDIGDLSIITSPGETDPAFFLGREEIVADYGERFGRMTFPAMPSIKKNMKGKHRAFLGQANNYLSYLVHSPDFVGALNFEHPVWYEDLVTVSKSFGDKAADKMMEILGSDERFTPKSPDYGDDSYPDDISSEFISTEKLLNLMNRNSHKRN